MFILHTSNKTENLLAHLDTVLSSPLSAPLLKEQFLIQSQGMERWLCQQLAEKKGVWANFEFYFPGKFFGKIVDQLKTEEATDIFSQEFLVWHFDTMLRDLDEVEFDVLQHYMQGESEDLKRYQLAEKLAYLFDQYQFMRPDWLAAWEQGKYCLKSEEEKWQSKLWQQLQAKQGAVSKGHLWLSVIDSLSTMDKNQACQFLPERLCVFGINAMSPIYLKFLETIGQFTNVHLFLLNPVEGYWADIATKQQLAKQVIANELQDVTLFQTDNPLLAALGQQGRDFQQLLLEQTEFELKYVSFEDYDSKPKSGSKQKSDSKLKSDTVLNCLQNGILHNGIPSQYKDQPLKADNSISFHACHSRMRETEVLKDQLLQCLDEGKDLSLRDIVVMTPNISLYAPYISAVFEDIPHAIADRSMLDSNDPLSIFLRFLSLSQNRWELESVFEVLEQAVVYQKLGLFETDLEVIRIWIEETHIRWGESADHRKELGFPAFIENSWKAGLDRLLMGYTHEDDSQFCDEVLPFAEIEGSQAQALGSLVDFFNLLGQAKKIFSAKHTLEYWVKHLGCFAEQLLDSTDEFQHHYANVMKLISDLQTYQDIHQQKLSLDVMLAWFTATANSQQSGAGFLRGQLTFCSMLPMRAIPFKVIALMGMNEGEYPRIENRPAFDLMANDFRKGDKSPRVDERYQFLEVVLSARQQLIITYRGQSQKSNEPIPSSVVIAELLEVLQECYGLQEKDLLTRHPLQAHSRHYFSASNRLFSYSPRHFAVSHALANHQKEAVEPWWQGAIADVKTNEQERVIDINDLLAFYRHPQQYFLINQLQITIPSIETRADETEPFALDGLMQYQIAQEWVERYVAGERDKSDDEEFYRQLMAQGRWLSGESGKITFDENQQAIETFAESVISKPVGEKLDPLAIDLEIGGYRLVGSLGQQYEQGCLIYRYANLKGKDLLPAWIRHLLSLQVQDKETWLVTKEEEWRFKAVENSEQILLDWVEHYIQGKQAPSPLLLEPAVAWQNQQHNARSRLTPLQRALRVYQVIIEYDADLQLLYQNLSVEDVINTRFEEACELLTPIWQARRLSEN